MSSGETLSGTVRPRGARAPFNFRVDIVALLSGGLTLSLGCVVWTEFHIGDGVFNDQAFGVSRLTWLNMHRLAAVVALASLAVHAWLHRRVILAKVRRVWLRLPGKPSWRDLTLYACFVVTVVTAIVAWFLVPGSAPLAGPVDLGPLPRPRHVFIDLHNFAGLGFLIAAALHVRRRWTWLAPRRNVA